MEDLKNLKLKKKKQNKTNFEEQLGRNLDYKVWAEVTNIAGDGGIKKKLHRSLQGWLFQFRTAILNIHLFGTRNN